MTIRLLVIAVLSASAACAQGGIQEVHPVATSDVKPTIVVSGMVERSSPDGDTSLPPDLRIMLDCHGAFSDGGRVEQSGVFRFQLTPDPMAIVADNICTAEAKSFGYDSTVAKFPVRSSSGLVNIGVITVTRNSSGDSQEHGGEKHVTTVSATSLKAPPNAVKLFDQGVRLLQQGKYANAAKSFESAIKIYPEYAECWLNLGRARVSLDTLAPGREAFLKAAELDPQMAGPPAELGLLAARQNDLPTAVKYLDESLRLDPASSYQACYSDALINLMLKRYDVAERSAREALRFGDSGVQLRVNYVLGMALLARGHNAEAKQRLTRYLELSPKAPDRDQVQKELARLERLEAGR